jgi:hypothetical protein
MDAALALIDIEKFAKLPMSALLTGRGFNVTIIMVVERLPIKEWDHYIRELLLSSENASHWKNRFDNCI